MESPAEINKAQKRLTPTQEKMSAERERRENYKKEKNVKGNFVVIHSNANDEERKIYQKLEHKEPFSPEVDVMKGEIEIEVEGKIEKGKINLRRLVPASEAAERNGKEYTHPAYPNSDDAEERFSGTVISEKGEEKVLSPTQAKQLFIKFVPMAEAEMKERYDTIDAKREVKNEARDFSEQQKGQGASDFLQGLL